MIVQLPLEPAAAYIRENLKAAGGISALLENKRMITPFAVAGPAATAEQLLQFNWAHDWGPLDADVELSQHTTERIRSDWWGIFHNPWSKEGDLKADECVVPDCFLFEGYCHVGEKKELPFADWYLRRIGFLMIIILVSRDPRPRIANSGGEISQQLAAEIADAATTVLLSAYDDESWVGAGVG